MTTITATLSAAGATTPLRLKRDESALVTIDATGGSFEGTVRIEESRNGQAWALASDRNGVPQTYAFALGAESTGVICAADMKNTSGNTLFYRVNASALEQDSIAVTLAESASEILAVILRDHLGRPVIGIRADSGVQFVGAGPVEIPRLLNQPEGMTEHVDDVVVSSADITGTNPGQLGHADGYPLMADPGAGKLVEFVSAIFVYHFAVAAYTAGGDLTIDYNGANTVSGAVPKADLLGGPETRAFMVFTETFAGGDADPKGPAQGSTRINIPGTGLVLNCQSVEGRRGAYTNPGTAAGVLRIRLRYRVHTLNLT